LNANTYKIRVEIIYNKLPDGTKCPDQLARAGYWVDISIPEMTNMTVFLTNPEPLHC
jgi:hypothetical protein